MSKAILERPLTWKEFEQLYQRDPDRPIERRWMEIQSTIQNQVFCEPFFVSIFVNHETTKLLSLFEWGECAIDTKDPTYRLQTLCLDDNLRSNASTTVKVLENHPHEKIRTLVETYLYRPLADLVFSYVPSLSSAPTQIESRIGRFQSYLGSSSVALFFACQDRQYAEDREKIKQDLKLIVNPEAAVCIETDD